MTAIRALCVAFSIYSKIPMPRFAWEEKELQYHLIFFPWVGAVIGLLLLGWQKFAETFHPGSVAKTLVGMAIPLLITGGFHVDGYMDTMDAFHSYGPREEKLRILKDPHIGAFSVIRLAVLGLLYGAAFSELCREALVVFALVFFASRCLSGLSVISFPAAKAEGMLFTFASSAKGANRPVRFFLLLQLLLCGGLMMWVHVCFGGLALAALLVCFLYYRYRSVKELGGITGDTAGYFVTVSETAAAVVLATACLWQR